MYHTHLMIIKKENKERWGWVCKWLVEISSKLYELNFKWMRDFYSANCSKCVTLFVKNWNLSIISIVSYTLCVLCVYTSLMCSIYTEVGRLINFRSAVARQILFTSDLQKQILNKLSDNTICVNQGQECLYVLQSTWLTT